MSASPFDPSALRWSAALDVFSRFFPNSSSHRASRSIDPQKVFRVFTVPIRNANTRAAYYRAIQQFLAWCERAGYQDLEDIEPITVAAYTETLQRQAPQPTVKQHMAVIRSCFPG